MTLMKSTVIAFAAALVLSACVPEETAPVALADSTAAQATARGSFTGKSNHVTTGHASIARQDGQWVVVLEDDFTFDGAPDPHVALGSDGYRADASLALLSANAGKQVYLIPAEIDVANFNEIWIWCNQFSVPLGVAPLTLT
ncbi:MAG: DM13 domain-containing protein [Pseudomonadota bacterium]